MMLVKRKSLTVFGAVCVAAASCRDATGPIDLTTLDAQAEAGNRGADPAKVMAIHVTITSTADGATIRDTYTFHVMRHTDGVKGRFQLRQSRMVEGAERAIVLVSGDMICMTIEGNRARVGGRVDQSSFPEGIPEGSELTWSVTDNGTSANADDSASQPLGNAAQAYCSGGLAYPEHPVNSGKITVKG